MLSLKDLFFSKILLLKEYVNNVQIIEGVAVKEELISMGKRKSLGRIMLEKRFIDQRQYNAVMQIQRQTLLTCKTCGLKYHLDELEADELFNCEVCGSAILRLEELASLDLEPLFQRVNSFDSRIIETSAFFLEAINEQKQALDRTEKIIDLSHREEFKNEIDPRKKTSRLRYQKEDESRYIIGKTLGGYKIEKKIGEGGTCVVFKAESDDKGQVAMKILKRIDNVDQKIVDRLIREASVASQLDHENIVSVLESGQEEGYYYIVMEFIEGSTLRQILLKKHRLETTEALLVIEQVARGLAEAHSEHFIHRDIKPDNIMIDKKGVAKIADFGLARGMSIDAHITQTGQIVGTPYYMSPEQAQSNAVDHRSDIYSLGVTFYYILTGRVPFDGATPIEIILKHISKDPDPPSSINPDIPPVVNEIILKMMSKAKEDRYQDAEELLEDLNRILNIQFTCICRNKLNFCLDQVGTIEKCTVCDFHLVVPPQDYREKKPVSYAYPDWKAFVMGRMALEKGYLSRERAAQGLKILLDSEIYGFDLTAEEVYEELGVASDKVKELEEDLKREIDIKNYPVLFGQIAIKNNLINHEQLLQALSEQEQSDPSPYLSEILIEKGLMDAGQRDSVLLVQKRFIVNRVDNILANLLVKEKLLTAEDVRDFSRELDGANQEEITLTLPQLLLQRDLVPREKIERLLYRCFFQNLEQFLR